jgi:hypothetical protein
MNLGYESGDRVGAFDEKKSEVKKSGVPLSIRVCASLYLNGFK